MLLYSREQRLIGTGFDIEDDGNRLVASKIVPTIKVGVEKVDKCRNWTSTLNGREAVN